MSERKQRTDSVAGEVATHKAAAAAPIMPPKHVKLRKQDMPFWEEILLARARDSWNASDLVPAAQLARCRADIEATQAILDVQPAVVRNARGTLVPNPYFMIMENLVRRQQSLMRIVYVHAQATVGSTGTAAKQSGAEKAAKGKQATTDGAGSRKQNLLGGRPALKAV